MKTRLFRRVLRILPEYCKLLCRRREVETGYRYIGRGIYSIPEVARLSGVNSRSVSRWVHGYRSSAHGGCFEGKPVFRGDFEEDGCRNLSFLDLIEIRFVHAFRGYGVSWKTIRMAMEKGCELLSETHPFSSKKFLTDGHDILYQVEQEWAAEWETA